MQKYKEISIGKLYRSNKKFIVFSEGVGWTQVNQDEIIIFITVEKPRHYNKKKHENDPIFIYEILKDNGLLVTKVENPEILHSFITKI